jgi:DNA-binding transcriptional ArsR family regulator
MSTELSRAFEEEDATGRYLRAVNHPQRRAVLSELLDSTAPLGVDELGSRVRERVETEGEKIALSLGHQHLPVLSETGLVRRSERGIVLLEPHRTLVERTLGWIDGIDTEVLDELGSSLSDPLLRATVVELDDRNLHAPVELECLASGVAERTDSERSTDSVAIDLHHHFLPKLDEAGVVEYDPEKRVLKRYSHSRSLIGSSGSILPTFSEV